MLLSRDNKLYPCILLVVTANSLQLTNLSGIQDMMINCLFILLLHAYKLFMEVDNADNNFSFQNIGSSEPCTSSEFSKGKGQRYDKTYSDSFRPVTQQHVIILRSMWTRQYCDSGQWQHPASHVGYFVGYFVNSNCFGHTDETTTSLEATKQTDVFPMKC